MVVRPRRWDVICGFFGEDRGVIREFWGEGLLGSRLFGDGSKFGSSGDFRDFLFQGGTSVKETGSASDNPVEGSVCICTG